MVYHQLVECWSRRTSLSIGGDDRGNGGYIIARQRTHMWSPTASLSYTTGRAPILRIYRYCGIKPCWKVRNNEAGKYGQLYLVRPELTSRRKSWKSIRVPGAMNGPLHTIPGILYNYIPRIQLRSIFFKIQLIS